MFVPHKPDLCFDVEKHSDRCVCGNSALVTNHEGIDTGYCDECAKKRKDFVDNVVGNIIFEKNNTLCSLLIIIENLRKSFLEERIYFMVDRYFFLHKGESFEEPYEDENFIAQVYREKYNLMNTFMSNTFIQDNPKLSNKKDYDNYVNSLNKMMQEDDDKLGEITARLCGYPYIKRKINKIDIL